MRRMLPFACASQFIKNLQNLGLKEGGEGEKGLVIMTQRGISDTI